MSQAILLVDDEPNVLLAYQRALHKRFELDTAPGGAEGLAKIASGAGYAVVVSDMRMPHMDGAQFLAQVKTRSPASVRLMLTGNADQETAIAAVNQGSIFRFLSKPCPPDALAQALRDAIEQHRLVTAEKELLEKTLRGSIRLVTEILSMLDPEGFGLAQRMRQMVHAMAKQMDLPKPWEIEMAAMLSPIALFTLPDETRKRYRSGSSLSETEQKLLAQAPGMSQRLLLHIPRLEGAASILYYQHKHFDGSGFPEDPVAGQEIPIASRVLKVVGDMLQLEAEGSPLEIAVKTMRQRQGWYDPAILDAACQFAVTAAPGEPVTLPVMDLKINQILAKDVITKAGSLLIRAGQVVTPTVLERLRNHAFLGKINDPVFIVGASRLDQFGDPDMAG